MEPEGFADDACNLQVLMEVTNMARIESVRSRRHMPLQSRIVNPSRGRPIRASIVALTMSPLLILLAWTAICAAATGPGIALKIGAQTLEDPIDLDKTTRARFELELTSPLLCDDHLDVAFAFGGSSLGAMCDDYAYHDDDVFVEESYDDHFYMLDVRLAARFYPLGGDQGLRPYVGAGLGYFWFLDKWDYEYAETYEDPLFPGTFYTDVGEEKGTDTMARGFFPFVMAGLAVSITDNADLLFELQYDLDKEDAGIDLGGPIYMFGGRFRF
jgi:hypothetical protein